MIGAGPNGLSAAIVLAESGHSVVVYEAADSIGGGARTASLTLPGFAHDVCSAVHPLALASPFFRTLPLEKHGLDWIVPPAQIAHPLDDGTAVVAERSLEATTMSLGPDAARYRALMEPLVANWPKLEATVLGDPRRPRHPLALARFAVRALGPMTSLARSFSGGRAQALLAGIAGHSMLPLEKPLTAGVALTLGALAHTVGWPLPAGGAQSIANALAGHLRSLGAEIVVSRPVRTTDELPPARAVLFDLSPRPLLRVAGHRLPPAYRRALERYRYGLAAFKVDWALDGPIPWRAAECARSATVHLGGTLEEIALSEREAWAGRAPERPYVILVQPTLFDPSRAPAGMHTAWAYCHLPDGCGTDMLPRIEAQVERFAPGFRSRILDRHIMTPAWLEQHNANLVGGDIAAGAMDLRQAFTRPTWRNHKIPVKGWYLCSAATPPGAGVHGMCGCLAAKLALREVFR